MANADHLVVLLQGAEVWNKWRELNPEIIPDLSGADLRGMEFRHLELGWSRSFHNCDDSLSDEDIIRMRPQGQGAILKGADLRGAYFSGCDFTGADLRESDLRRTILLECTMTCANFHNAKMQLTDLTNSFFLSPCNLTVEQIKESRWVISCNPLLPEELSEVEPILNQLSAFYDLVSDIS